ncbi:unnamed protein product, partial [Orchesella dallaii]
GELGCGNSNRLIARLLSSSISKLDEFTTEKAGLKAILQRTLEKPALTLICFFDSKMYRTN